MVTKTQTEPENASVLKFLYSMRETYDSLGELYSSLSDRPGFDQVCLSTHLLGRALRDQSDRDRRRHCLGVCYHLEAELSDHTWVVWNLEVLCDEQGWQVECREGRMEPGSDYSQDGREFPPWQGATLEEMTSYLPGAVAELRRSAERPRLLQENISGTERPDQLSGR